MAIILSPGVNVTEVDLTTVVPSVSSTTAAFAGKFAWGPANTRKVIDSEITLVNTYGTPDTNTYVSFFTCSSFLAYGNDLRVVRAANTDTLNATADGGVQIANEDEYQHNYYLQDNGDQYGAFAARYPGGLGNSLQVDVFDSADQSDFDEAYVTIPGVRSIKLSSLVSGVPGTSDFVKKNNGANDEFHIVVTDADGAFTGTKGTVLEVFQYVSKAIDALDGNAQPMHYKHVINAQSKYIYALDPVDYANTSSTWNTPSIDTEYDRISGVQASISLSGGSDGTVGDDDIESAYDLFTNKDEVDISLVLTGDASVSVQQYVIDNVVTAAGSLTGRAGDAIAFISPPRDAVVNNSGSESDDIKTWLGSLSRSTSYAVVDSGWKYMFDKYNNVYRYVPLNGDIAGLCVFTDAVRDPWYSPAGFNRGNIKNVVKLAWNPNQTHRDILYPMGVNPVVSFPGNGTVLYGDKTLQAKPSAFDRINVRRLFIVLEKAISRAAKYSLFELNDEFTRAQFVALVTPFLRDVKGRRGIYDFKVVCDSTNNTPYIIDTNQFVGDIYIKPARSINFIKLNFIAVGTGVQFSEVTGAI